MLRRLATILVLGTLLLSTTTPIQAAELEGLPEDAQEAEVSGHIDGDKIFVKVGDDQLELNFIGADAPEPDECHAEESSTAVKRLLKEGTVVYLEKDTKDRDGKNRLLRHVWTADKSGEKAYLINTKLVRDGLAAFQDKDDGNDKYNARLKKAQQQAKDKGVGIWENCGGPHEPDKEPTGDGFGFTGTNDFSKVVPIEAGTYSTEASCDNTAMQVYIFDLEEELVAWPVSRSRLDEDEAPEFTIPADGEYEIEVYCDGDWSVRFTLDS